MAFKLKACELKLGDVLQIFDGPYGTGTVTRIWEGQIDIERPYGHTSDFSYSGGSVVFYTGMEHMQFPVDSSRVFNVWARGYAK
jgi:hypothetical protein